jgi:ribosomal protein S18 acetylase RimI-like enzyme
VAATPAIVVRQAAMADLDAIAPPFDAYRQFYGKQPDPGLARRFLRERLERSESVVLVANDKNGNAVGFAQLYPSFSSGHARSIFVLNDLFVVPASRRLGVGRLLLDAAADFDRKAGAARLTLVTAVSNTTAQSLYETAGWNRDTEFYTYHLPL